MTRQKQREYDCWKVNFVLLGTIVACNSGLLFQIPSLSDKSSGPDNAETNSLVFFEEGLFSTMSTYLSVPLTALLRHRTSKHC